MARTKPAQERRDDLLDAAQAAFIEHGITATTVDDIATRAGVAKGTFYLYFQSRADIVRAVRHRYGERFVRRFETVMDDGGDDWAGKLDAIVAATLADDSESRALHRVLIVDVPHAPGEYPDIDFDRLVTVFRSLLDQGVAAGVFDIADTGLTAMVLLNALRGVYSPIWDGSSPPGPTALVAAAQEIFRRAVGLGPGSSTR